MLRIFFCCLPALFFCGSVFSQKGEPQSEFLMELKRQLPAARGLTKVRLLNKIAGAYIYSPIVRSDSGLVHSREAMDSARAYGDTTELCKSINLYAILLLQLSRADEGLKYYHELAQLGRLSGSTPWTMRAVRGIGQALWYQANFKEAADTISLSLQYFRTQKDTYDILDAMTTLSSIYGDQGDYEKAFDICRQALTISEEKHNDGMTVLCMAQLGMLYYDIGDYTTAMDYYRKGFDLHPEVGIWNYRYLSGCTGDLYSSLRQYDSAYFYYQQSFTGNSSSKLSRRRLGYYYLARENYDTAFLYFKGLYDDLKGGGEGHLYMYAMLGMAQVYLAKKEYDKALHYGHRVLQLAQSKNAKLNTRDACQLLSRIYSAIGSNGRALDYYKQYVQMKDSVVTDQFRGRLYAFKRQAEDERQLAQIQLLEKERLLTQQKLKGNQQLRNILAGGLLVFILLGFILFRNTALKRRNEKLQAERIHSDLQHRARELEMQALRAQMNPHFIFNSLSSINRFILKNEADKASDYLIRFSRLIRLVLINSQKQLIRLEDEVEMLRLYIEMEQLRFRDSFDYSIRYINDIQPDDLLIPPMLLQPFCENAIWHGLMHKEGRGQLSIEFEMQQNILLCVITDNGVGRARAAQLKGYADEKIKSLGLQLTTERLALFNENNGTETFYEIEDVRDQQGNTCGTKVILKIRYREFSNETA
ncbi:MAG: tetratricopeptide repeat protein [Bacteroidetes bacterium]|nr:tetratricopeptide repeat protein [Bacteroidota bacterium]